MKINDDDLKRLFRSSIKDRMSPSRQACPDPELISDLFFQPVGEKQKKCLMDHISECSHCLEVFDLCLNLSRSENWLVKEIQARTSEESGSVSILPHLLERRQSLPRLKWVLLPLATVVLLTIAVLMTKTILSKKLMEDRGRLPGIIDLIYPSKQVSSSTSIIFRWEIRRPVEWVQLDLFNEDLTPLWKSPKIFDSHYLLPSEARQKMESGKTYFWMVTAFFPDGNEAESSLAEFSLRD